MEIAYFDRFQDALRPVHCAIMLRNVKILRALTERNLQFDQIQATCDRRNEKNFQKELLRLVCFSKTKFSKNLGKNLHAMKTWMILRK